MDNASCSCFAQSSEYRLIEKYIRVARPRRSMMKHRLDGMGVYCNRHQILMFVPDNLNVSQKELARMYGVSGVTMAASLEKLEEEGYIRRLVDQEDSRCNQICITDKDRKMVEDSIKILRRTECRMSEGLSENDMKVLGGPLDRIYGNLNREFMDRVRGEGS